MNFDLTEEQQMIKKMIREFADEVVAPGAIDRDRTKEFPEEIFKQLSEMGMMGLPFSEEYGGGGADTMSFAIVTEELSRACASTGITYSAHISLGGSTAQFIWNGRTETEVFNTNLYRGIIRCIWIDRTECRIGCGGTQTTAKEDGDDFVINGSKVFITNASYAKHLAITAITGNERRKERNQCNYCTD